MQLAGRVPSDPEGKVWDVVIVGTGAGGGAAGFKLARRGKSVLFLERGGFLDNTVPTSRRPEIVSISGNVDHELQEYGAHEFEFKVGSGVGGTTTLFAMVMDRFRPVDFTPYMFSNLAPRSSLPTSWPIVYEELEPYYREAEALFRIQGSPDPLTPIAGMLRAPFAPSDADTGVLETLARGGLRPYSLHYACERISGCNGCPGTICPKPCRNDVCRMCILPALENHNAYILPNCLVTKLETTGRNVSHVICSSDAKRLAIRARIIILALNALSTPALLLRSANPSFPDGVGNSSGLVGRNLMTHVSDHLAVRIKGIGGMINSHLRNGISINDFYFRDGVKLGNIHAHAMALESIIEDMGLSSFPDDSIGTVLFSTIVEDFPYVQNQVFPKPGSQEISWRYNYPAELRSRSSMLLREFAGALPECEIIVKQPSGMLNVSHVCGTCRFGNDALTSVLDKNNRVHDMDNVYVLDGSFFPSSGGINPSLTIVANSLRVGELI